MKRLGAFLIAVSACTSSQIQTSAPIRKSPDYIARAQPKEETPCRIDRALLRGEKEKSKTCTEKRVFVLTDNKKLVTVYRDSSEEESGVEHISRTNLGDILVTGDERWTCSPEDACYFLLQSGQLAAVALDDRIDDDTRVYDLKYDVSQVEIFAYDNGHLTIAPVIDQNKKYFMVFWFSDGIQIKKGELIPED